MFKISPALKSFAQLGLVVSTLLAAVASNALVIPSQPLSAQTAAKPMIMIALGRDHRLFYEAYNDASDIDGDGAVDIRFKPAVTYLGLFNSAYCYTHNNKDDNTGQFTPAGLAIGTNRTCNLSTGGQWSGNWLNYVTTSRIDALRVVLYGGMRDVDTATNTVLRRAYIPQDAHSWAKEYTSETVDGYKISDYTPIPQPASNSRHFFGNLTPNATTDCATLSNCSGLAPWLSVVQDSNLRVWEWASTERPVLNGSGGGTRTNRTVRVEVCSAGYAIGCKAYGSSGTIRKPVGILHDFGENEEVLFGLVTGSYDSNTQGGRLRKVMSSFKAEVDQTDGSFTSNAEIVKTINSLRLLDFNNGRTDQIYNGSVLGTRAISNGENPDWGNPIGEIMYEAVRYMANRSSATSEYTSIGTTLDDKIGLPKPSFDQPYSSSSAAKAPWCARASLLTISDTNISFDSDGLPGANWAASTLSTTLSGKSILSGNTATTLNVTQGANLIGANESGIAGLRFIGQSGSVVDNSPSAKNVTNLGNIRGLAPEEPTKQGSYYSAAVSHYAKINDLQTSRQGNQTIDSFVVSLASPLLRIEAKLPNGRTISLLPFAKSVGGAFGIESGKDKYQPTNQIVDFYVQSIANSSPADTNTATNGGRYEAVFRINFEDVEQGNDHDMDAIVEYTVRATASNTLQVLVRPTYQAGGVQHRMGYIISGTTQDGVYLVVQDESDEASYFLNVPPGRTPGYCDQSSVPSDCTRLPYLGGTSGSFDRSTRTFTASSSPAAQFLKDPLWYAAKWGGFVDANGNGIPDIQGEWDKDGDGVPDNYFFVQNPTKLRDSLTAAFNAIIERNASSSNIATNNRDVLNSNTRIYRASYTAGVWSGDITAFPVTTNGVGVAPSWEASAKLPAWASRNIFMRTSSNTTVNLASTGYASLPLSDRTALVSDDVTKYIRGDRSKEIIQGGSFRDRRQGVLPDFIHSSPIVDLDDGAMFIGGNGGMFHSFDLATGVERFAFIPHQVVPRLKNLSASTYNASHEYFVDGEASLGFSLAASNNTKYLYALLGRGGKGLFSGRANGNSWTHLWEYTPGASTAAAADLDLGLMTSRPLYAVMNNNMSAFIVGNGYNSTNQKAVLYIFLLNTDGTLNSVRKLDTGIAGDNGLAGPAFIDTTGDGKADFIFAGDRRGNLWKFDVSSATPASWGVALAGSPLFQAKNSSNQEQPITAPLYIAKNNVATDPNFNKHFIYFGTGQYIATGDNNITQTQSIYGIIDSNTAITGRTSLRQRTIPTTGTVTGVAVRTISAQTAGDMSSRNGWYLDLTGPFIGERVIGRAQIVSTIEPALLVPSFYPINNDPCIPGGSGYFNYLNPWSGARIDLDLLDIDRNGKFDSADRISGVPASSVNLGVGIPTVPLFIPTQKGNPAVASPVLGLSTSENKRFLDGNGSGAPDSKDCVGSGLTIGSGSEGTGSIQTRCAAGGNLRGRVLWREIIRD
jgi:type IV pilus assembly protein PilY1